MSFPRHREIYRSDVRSNTLGATSVISQRSSASMSFQPAIPWQVALQQSLPPLHRPRASVKQPTLPDNAFTANGNNPLIQCLSTWVQSSFGGPYLLSPYAY